MKTIVVTTDLSEESKVAFPLARSLAEMSGAKIELLAVVEDPAQAALMYALDFPVLPGKEVLDQLKEKVSHDLEKFVEQDFAGAKVSTSVVESAGAVHDAITHFAQEKGADMVVIATHGRTGLSRLLIGSVAERVVRECPLPVLTVPSQNP
ncbi:MAG: universal stress protein [Bdellovibrionales bacterium]|nr:universal stress protein [Bdellovibrionales bacterium]